MDDPSHSAVRLLLQLVKAPLLLESQYVDCLFMLCSSMYSTKISEFPHVLSGQPLTQRHASAASAGEGASAVGKPVR